MSFSASPIAPSNRQFTDTNGVPLAGGSVSYYSPATLVAKTTWIDENQVTPNPTTITLDSAGRATVFGSGDYRELVKDINGNTILDTTTNVPVASTGVVTGTQLITNGNIISGAWTTFGIRAILNTATYTDTTSAGTVPAIYIDFHGNGVVTTSNVVTFTAAYGAFFQTPTAGANTTFTKAYGLGADAAFITALTATMVNKVTITPPATSSTLTIADGKTFTVNQTLTLTGTTGTTMTFPATSATIARTDAGNTFTGNQTVTGTLTVGLSGGAGRVTGPGAAGSQLILGSIPGNQEIVIDGSTATATLASGSVKFSGVSTTASAANAFLDNSASNNLLRSTSSIRYKTDVQYLSGVSVIIDALKPMTYRSLATADDPNQRHYGLLAEEVAKVDPTLVQWTGAGDVTADAAYLSANAVNGKVPDGVQYERLVVLLLAEVQSLRARLIAAGIA